MAQTWHALERRGCEPKGERHRFTAKCPAHDDRRPSLAVAEGSDRRVLPTCRAGCDTADIVVALGLRLADLFATGHKRGPQPKQFVRRALSPAEALIEALNLVG